MLFPPSDLVVVFCTSQVSRIIKGNYRLYRIEFTQQHPTPPREVMTNLVITSLFLIPDPSFVCPGAFRFSIGFENTVSDCRNEGYTWHAERPRGPIQDAQVF